MSVLTATTTILLVLVVTFILYMIIKKFLKSRQALIRNYDMPEVVTMDGNYETLQRKKQSDEVGNNPAVNYMEIAAISSEYINLNWKQSYSKDIDMFAKRRFAIKCRCPCFFLPQNKNHLNELFTDAQPGRIHSSIQIKWENIALEIIVFLFVNIANNSMYDCDLTCIQLKCFRQSVLPSF